MSDIDLGALMQQAQQLRDKMEYMQKGLAEQKVEGSSGGGMVKVTVGGDLRVHTVEIDPSVMDEDRAMIQDLIVAAVNNGLEKARELAQEQLGSMLPPGMAPGGIPGL